MGLLIRKGFNTHHGKVSEKATGCCPVAKSNNGESVRNATATIQATLVQEAEDLPLLRLGLRGAAVGIWGGFSLASCCLDLISVFLLFFFLLVAVFVLVVVVVTASFLIIVVIEGIVVVLVVIIVVVTEVIIIFAISNFLLSENARRRLLGRARGE